MKNKTQWRALGLAVLCLVTFTTCRDAEKETRYFHMGFTPFPYEISLEAIDFTYDKISEHADIINHHFDNGVPWPEAFENLTYSNHLINDWQNRKNRTQSTHKIYVSVSPINIDRTGLAAYHGSADNMDLPSPWDTYTFSDEAVKTAYLNYCKRIIEYFNPDYFNMAIEANLLYANNASSWNAYMTLHKYIYENLKTTYPELPIFSSVSGAILLDGFIGGNDFQDQRLRVQELLAYSDLYALSFYPYMSAYLGNSYPENSFDELFKLSDKPLAVAETGYPAQSFSIDVGQGKVTINSDEEKQRKFFEDLFAHCNQYRARFVINFVVRDYDQLWEQIGAKEDLTIAWRDTGLFDENGETRSSFDSWNAYFKREVQHE